MRRWLSVHRTVRGRPRVLERAFLDHVTELLVAATGSDADRTAVDGSFRIALTSRVWTREVARTVRVRVGIAHHPGARAVLPVSWTPDPPNPAFPGFDGAFELEPVSGALSTLALVGAYTPPLGPVGAAIDATVLTEVAETTARRLVSAVARRLEALATRGEAPPPLELPPGRLRVRDVMTPDPMVVDPTADPRTAARLLFHLDVSGAPVVDADGGLVGVVSEHDLLSLEADPRPGRHHRADVGRRAAGTVAELCTSPARTTVPDALLGEVAREMIAHAVARMVVVDGGGVVGIVSRHDVLRALLRTDDELAGAVDEVLAHVGATDVLATVRGGVVELAGSASARSLVEAVRERVAAIDGVADVVSAVRWRTDDLVPPADLHGVT